MADRPDGAGDEPRKQDEKPRWQQWIFDDIVLLLVLGLAVPTIFYIILGVIDLTTVPTFER